MSAQQPLVSVIVRTKDRPEQLQDCLNSIARQDYRPIHVVVVNDGGADISNVVTPFESNLKITLIHLKRNEGRTAAANHGLNGAEGDYVCFLDDDDYWLPNHLSSLVAHLFSANSTADTTSNFPDVAIYSATKAVMVDADSQEQEIKIYNVEFDKNHLLYNNFLPILSVLFNRSVIDAGVRFDSSFDLFEDWDFWLQVSQRIPFISTPDVTCVYRLHEHASGVHNTEQATKAYQSIYKKWLGDYSSANIYELLRKTHQWHDESIDSLQRVNQKKMEAIGEQHSYALSVIDIKDANITTLEKLYSHAEKVIKRKDQASEQLAKDYNHAIEVIQEKDRASEQLAKDYAHAIEVIQEKDRTSEQLAKDYAHAIEVIQEKDRASEQLAKDYANTTEIIQKKDLEYKQLNHSYENSIHSIQLKSDIITSMEQELSALREEVDNLYDRINRPLTSYIKHKLWKKKDRNIL